MAGSQREVTVRWSGQLSMKDDFLVVWSAGHIMSEMCGGGEQVFGAGEEEEEG